MATLDTALDKLQSLLSQEFVVTSVPVITFAALHGAVAYTVSPRAREFIEANLLAEQTVAAALFTLLFLVVLTYVLAALNTPLREVMEGKIGWPEPLANAFRQKYVAKLARIEDELLQATRTRRELDRHKGEWANRMSAALEAGNTQATCHYSRSAWLSRLTQQVAWNRGVSVELVENTIRELCTLFAANNVFIPMAADDARRFIDDQQQAARLIREAIDWWDSERARLQNQIHFEFAGRNVAPTRMGNLATVATYYAQSRYAMDLHIFWTVLQKVMQADTAFASLLENSKQKLDFLVALFGQTVFFSVFWMICLPIHGGPPWLFVTIAVGGLVFASIWYGIAVTHYREFSTVVRAGIDLYRLEVLQQLHIQAPVNTEQERVAWEALGQRIRYGERDSIPLASKTPS